MRLRLGSLILVSIASASLLGGIFGEKAADQAPLPADSQSLLQSFSEAFAIIQANYSEPVTSDRLVESAIRGMLRTLDPHSSFFSTEDYDRLQEEQKGKYYGLGITIRPESPGSGRVVVVEPPQPGTPAYKAGLRAGDVIAKIEGTPIDDWDVNTEVIPNLKGPKGTKVNITVERPNESEPLEVAVERDEIPLLTIKYAFRIRPSIGYIRIIRFAETTGRELDDALASIDESTLQGLILDLRDDPGGALTQALEVSDRFLDAGQKIVSTRSRNGKESRDYKAKTKRSLHYPMVVLINRNSASASEIVSGALQDHDRAYIIGETSFGKALVQTIFPLDGNRALALTTGKYYTPSNRLIQRDYSEGFLDYYSNRETVKSSADGPKYYTDGGRIVYGGGGIAPDEVITPARIPLAVRKLQRKNLFRDFAADVAAKRVDSELRVEFPKPSERWTDDEVTRVIADFNVGPEALAQFRDYAASKGVTFADEEWQENGPVIANFMKQEFLLLLVGDEASYRVALELDNQVLAGIDRLPQASALLRNPGSLAATSSSGAN